jgi:WXG100 family type VII secretion target
MAGQIRMTPDQMRIRSGDVARERDKFEDLIRKMQGIINELQTEWEGEASRSFAAQFDALKPSFESKKQLLDDISMQLAQTADSVEQLDKDIASKFGVK